MTRAFALIATLALVCGTAWGCATTGSAGGNSGVSLSASRYTAEDLARLPHENLYDFFRQHHRIRIGQSTDRRPLGVRHRGSYVPARLYVNDSEVANPVAVLRQTAPREVAYLEVKDPREASTVRGDAGLFAVITLSIR